MEPNGVHLFLQSDYNEEGSCINNLLATSAKRKASDTAANGCKSSGTGRDGI